MESMKVAGEELRHISREPLDPAKLLQRSHHAASGAVVLFSGEARNHHRGKGVTGLEYEAQERMAERSIQEILEDAIERFGLNSADCVHRVGNVPVGESAVVVAVSAAHRGEAFEAARWIIDRVKKESPIWKREFFSDGDVAWGVSES